MTFMDFQGPGFMLRTPTDWYITSSPQLQAVFVGPQTDGGVRPNLTVAIRPVEADVTPLAVAAEARKTQENQYPEYEVQAETDFAEQGGAGFIRRYRWLNSDRNVPVVQVQAFHVYEGLLYTLTATSTEVDFPDVEQTFDTMLMSFRFVS